MRPLRGRAGFGSYILGDGFEELVEVCVWSGDVICLHGIPLFNIVFGFAFVLVENDVSVLQYARRGMYAIDAGFIAQRHGGTGDTKGELRGRVSFVGSVSFVR